MKIIFFSCILTINIFSFDILSYLKQKEYSYIFFQRDSKYIFQKKKIKIVIQEDNNIFLIDKYCLNFNAFPFPINGQLKLSPQDENFFTNVISKIERRYLIKEKKNAEKKLVQELSQLKKMIIPTKKYHQPSTKIKYIFLDPGHGGVDPGATAFGYLEKNFTLNLATNLKKALLDKIPDIKIILTRVNDKSTSLAERCNFANSKLKTDNGIFISLHLNSWLIPDARGFEVYFLSHNKSSLTERIRSFENGVYLAGETNLTQLKYYEKIFGNINVIQYQKESRLLAGEIISTVYQSITNYTVNRGRKSDLFYVLKGTLMPSILIEAGFISNKKDLEFLSSKDNLKLLTKSIASGVSKYINEYNSSKGFTTGIMIDE